MPIKISTFYSENNLLEFNKYLAKSKKAFWVFMITCTLIVVLCFVFCAFINALSFEMYLYLFLVIFLDFLYAFLYILFPRLTLKKQKSLNTSIAYSFDAESFTANSQNDYATENATVKYTMLSKVAKNNNFLYLFISATHAYIVDISQLSSEDKNNLKSVLQPYFKPNKFKW